MWGFVLVSGAVLLAIAVAAGFANYDDEQCGEADSSDEEQPDYWGWD